MHKLESAQQKSLVHEYVGTLQACACTCTHRVLQKHKGAWFINVCGLHLLSGTVIPQLQPLHLLILKVISVSEKLSLVCRIWKTAMKVLFFSQSWDLIILELS